MSSDWLEDLNSSCKNLDVVYDLLVEYSDAFSITGNRCVADKLYNLAQMVNYESGVISQATGKIVSEQVKHAEEATANMLSAIFFAGYK